MTEIQSEQAFQQATQDCVIVDFYADWCGPCRQMAPKLKEANVPVVKVDVDANPSIAQDYGVMSLPTLALFQNGQEVDRITGATGKQKIESLYQKCTR